jgi:group I intron endonuclease
MARKEKKYHYIYKTTNLKNGKYYIGMHSTDNLEDGYMGSGKRLKRSLNKHGKENFKFEILEFFSDRKSLIEGEKKLVNEELLKDSLSMNIKKGGEGGTVNDEHRKNLKIGASKYQKNKWSTDIDYRDKIKKVLLDNIKKSHLLGKIKYNTFEGKNHSDKTKKKMSETKKDMYIGEKNPSYGTCWITNGKENKKIEKEKINDYLCDGWYKGRKI